MSNLLESVGLSFPLAIGMGTIWISRVDSRDSIMDSWDMSSVDSGDMGSSVYCRNSVSYSCGRLQSSSMSIVNTSDHSTSSLSMSNLLKSVGLSLPLAIGMDTIWISRVDSRDCSMNCSMNSGEMGSIHSRDMGNSGVSYG